jgi:fructose-1,6-bisphosphatase/inositol monophosphatase family enzyme
LGYNATDPMVKKFPAQDFIEDLTPAIREASAVARKFEAKAQNFPKTGETSDVKAALTLADTECQEILLQALLARFGHVALEAEEDTASVAAFSQAGPELVVMDPIDGTLRSYLERRGPYGVMVGIALDGCYEAALVSLPREDLFFTAVRGEGAQRAQGEASFAPASVEDQVSAGKQRVLVSYEMPEGVVEDLEGMGFEVGYGCGGALAVATLIPGVCGSLRWCPEQGVSIRGKVGLLIAREAGALVCDSTGGPFTERLSERSDLLLTAANQEILDQLLQTTSQHMGRG